MADPRRTRAWRKLRDQVVREEPLCRIRIVAVCTRASTTADHILPVATHPHLALVRTNLRGSCEPCNRARGHLPLTALVRADADDAPALSIFD